MSTNYNIIEEVLSILVDPPTIDETDDEITIKVNTLGVEADDVEVEIEDGTLYAEGGHDIEDGTVEFECYFELPDSADIDAITSSFAEKAGVLTITIPKITEEV